MELDYDVKADALEDSFDAIMMPAEKPMLAAAGSETAIAPATNAFANGYLRKGIVESGTKSFNGATTGDGGFAIPKEIDAVIDAALKSISPIRRIANVVQIGSAGYRKLVTQNGVMSGWAAEGATRPETSTPTFNEIVPPMGDLYANAAASQAMLDDANFDVESWLADEISVEFARAEGAAFVAGSGTNRPKGFLTAPTAVTSDATRAFGTLQYTASGAAGAFAASNPQDKLIDLVQSLRSPYRQGATWVMNAKTLATVRKFKDSTGAFLWQPGLIAGNSDTLLGYPIVEAEDMPDIAADTLSIAFGNFKAGYLITERAETHILCRHGVVAGWAWRDGVDVPLGESREAWRLTITPLGAPTRTIETTDSRWLYDAAAIAADKALGASLTSVAIVQIGDCGVSPASSISITLT